jgi:MoxR-like ATPase
MSDTVDTGKNCQKCPAFCTAEASIGKFKKSTGAPMCGRFGHVLGKPGLTNTQQAKIQTHFANNCEAYGQPMPDFPVRQQMEVALGDTAALTRAEEGIDAAKQNAVTTCAMCKNFVRDDAVASELGWTTGMCAAKGKLILTNRQVHEARGCRYREFGQVRNTTAGIHLLPVYEEAFNLTSNPIVSYFKSKEHFVEPHEYPTDKPVTDEDRASGIRAWFRVPDPSGSDNETFLPTYDPDFFTPEERGKIPRTNDDEHPELYVDHFGGTYLAAVAWTELDETPALWGEAGTGKTELLRHLAWRMCLPFERINITAQTEVDDLVGKMLFDKEKGTYFSYGRLPLAWEKPCVLCVDEPNVGPPEVWQAIRPLTDNSKQMVIDQNAGERKARNADCYLGFAMNPAWDPKNIGALPVSDADVNRLFHVHIELPPPELEREIIRNRVLLDGWEMDDDRLDMVMKIAEEIRNLIKEGLLSQVSWAIRPQIKVSRALRWFEPVTAYRRAIADFLEPTVADALLDVVRAHAPQ